MRLDGVFIAVEVDDRGAADAALVARLTEACPVDIFAQAPDGALALNQSSLDECVLCHLCLDAAPEGVVRVIKLYDHEAVMP